jgi:hypothetical protein
MALRVEARLGAEPSVCGTAAAACNLEAQVCSASEQALVTAEAGARTEGAAGSVDEGGASCGDPRNIESFEDLQQGPQQFDEDLLPDQQAMEDALAVLASHADSECLEPVLQDGYEEDCGAALEDGYEEDCEKPQVIVLGREDCSPLLVTVLKQEALEEGAPAALLEAVKEDPEEQGGAQDLPDSSGAATESAPEQLQHDAPAATPWSYGQWGASESQPHGSWQGAPASSPQGLAEAAPASYGASLWWWTPQVSEVLSALRDVYLSGLACGKLIDFRQLFSKVQNGEVCIAGYYSSKLFVEICQELCLPKEQVTALGVKSSLPVLSSIQQSDLFALFEELLPSQYVEEGLPSRDLSEARWLCYEIVESTERPSEKDICKVFQAMQAYYKISCFLKKQPCMGIPHEVVRSLLCGRKLSRREVDETVHSLKAFFETRLPYVSELSRYDLEALKERRLCYVSGRLSLQWLYGVWGKIREKLAKEDQSPGAEQSLPECCVYDLERLRRTGLYPELDRRSRLRKAEARSSMLPHEEARKKRMKLSGQWSH